MKQSAQRCLETPILPVNRRAFLVRAALAAMLPVTSGAFGHRRGLGLSSQPSAAPQPTPLPGLEAFAPLVGSVFTVVGTSELPSFPLTLTKAEALKRHQPGVSEKFSLRFTPPAGHKLEGRTYAMVHPSLGRLELFLCPVGSAGRYAETQKAEAIIDFNCLAA